jgi:F-type H+-transporting ATPase subunit epsilon
MATFELEIVTPGKTLYSGTVEHVGAPGIDGGFGVLSRHQQMVAALGIGSLRFREEGGEERLAAIEAALGPRVASPQKRGRGWHN